MESDLKIAIVAENASTEFGGEAFIPLQLFKQLKIKEIDVILITHARCRDAIKRVVENDAIESVIFIEDSWLQKFIHWIGGNFPRKLRLITTDYLIGAYTVSKTKKILRSFIDKKQINLIHQPIPVSPRIPSKYYNLQVPVVIGPMNGNLDYPPAFKHRQPKVERLIMRYAPLLSPVLNFLIPGKRKAHRLLVANKRTAEALPTSPCNPKVLTIPENGVTAEFKRMDLERDSNKTRYIFVGGLEPYKAVDIVIEAFANLPNHEGKELYIVGKGREAENLKQLAVNYNVYHKTVFLGHLSHVELVKQLSLADIFVFPSLDDCGGAVILEAMALELPIIASNWGGPIDYVDPSCGILIDPNSHASFVSGFTEAMELLAHNLSLRIKMGNAGRQKVEEKYTWAKKAEQLLEIYDQAILELRDC